MIHYFEKTSNKLQFDFQFLEFRHDNRKLFLITPESIQSWFKCVSRFCMHNVHRQIVPHYIQLY